MKENESLVSEISFICDYYVFFMISFFYILYKIEFIVCDNTGFENILNQKVFSFKKYFQQKWKNAKVNRKEEEENEKTLKGIMEKPGKNALKNLVSDIEKYEKEELDDKIKGNDQFNTVCWIWGIENCHKERPDSKMDNDDAENIFNVEKHYDFLNRKFII